ncbi:MAG TPA: hypothetical protein VFK89_06550 [Actinomycetota bacterium]|nr:hypothetical protein [Actinomycetota bacterium]
MKKILVVALAATLVLGALAPAQAKKKKKHRKPTVTSVDQKFFMRRDDCGGDADNTRLSLLDGPDTACWFVDAGIAYEAIDQAAGAGAPFDSSVLWEQYPAADGVPLTLDTSRPITGEITLYGGDCVQDPACSPAGLTAGQATFRVRVIGTVAGEDKELGTFEDTFTSTPGSTHTSKVSIQVDPSFDKVTFEALRLEVFKGGEAYGPGGIEYDSPASFLAIPSWIAG